MNNFNIEKMIDHATEYYFYLADKLVCRQDNLFRTYLWVALSLITLHVAMIKEIQLKLYSSSMYCSICTLALLILTLGDCIWSMRGKQSARFPNIRAYAMQEADPDKLWTLKDLFEDFCDVIHREESDRTKRGLKLRDISLCLTVSIGMTIVTAIVILVERG